MNSRGFLAILCLLSTLITSAQLNDNAYRSSTNKYYWQNRRPDAAYWQQDVQYRIYAKMNEFDHVIEGAEELTYWNNSPDTLHYVYFHLFQNAFVKGSYLRDLEIANKVKSRMGKKEASGLGIVLENVQVDGQAAKTELDNTIMKVYLKTPLVPGARVVFKMSFNTYYDNGATRRRMKMYPAWGFMHYNGCQWFPKVCVYDRMHGWDTYQHLNREFYGDFGLYDVTLDFPSNYVLEASGELQNRSEVLPDTLRAKLELKNFANKKTNEPPSIITPYIKGQRKKWHFIANNVHDFAFTGDPSYRIGTAYWNGVECVAIAQEPHAAGWQNAPDYITKIIKTFSEGIGMYCYPKIVAADAADGMEYPMLTLDGGADPGYRGLLVHEIAHNWFYGQVGSNETYRAAMDEGFTQFLTALGLRRIDGDNLVTGQPKSKYRRHFAQPINVLDLRVLNSYTTAALNQNELSINTHSDDFHSALGQGGGYGAVYYKTASMLYNLEYVLGDSLFERAMMHYFDQWKFAHPYFEDFRASIIQYTKVDLAWFFDQWFETTKTLDYGICGIRKIRGTDSFAINLRRSGEMQMPLDLTVTAKDGSKHNYYIPNTWFEKSTTATTLPRWYGWGKLHEHYTARVQMPAGIKHVQIDTTFRFADKNMVDNYRTRGAIFSPRAVKTMFDGGLAGQTDRKHYRMYVRPDAWWNPIDGIKAGLHFEGDYLSTLYKIDATIWWNTHLLQEDAYKSFKGESYYERYKPVNYSFNYNSPVTRNMPRLQLQLNSRYLDGLWAHRAGFNWLTNDKNTVQLYGQMLWRPSANDLTYLADPGEWSSSAGRKNNSVNAAWTHRYEYVHGQGRYTLGMRAPILQKDALPFSYSYAQLESVNYGYIDQLEIRTRVFGRFGLGRQMPYESMLYMAGASPEEQMENKYTRSIGFAPTDWQGTSLYDVNHLQQGGGLNLRGYAGYYSPDEHNGGLLTGYKGRSGASASMEIGFGNYLQWRPRLTRNWLKADIYAFGDAGVMELSRYSTANVRNTVPTATWSTLHADAGAGFAFTIKSWGVFEKARPLTIRVDFPVFLNRPPYGNNQYATLRYVIGINRAF
jgi:aminopeptidase N